MRSPGFSLPLVLSIAQLHMRSPCSFSTSSPLHRKASHKMLCCNRQRLFHLFFTGPIVLSVFLSFSYSCPPHRIASHVILSLQITIWFSSSFLFQHILLIYRIRYSAVSSVRPELSGGSGRQEWRVTALCKGERHNTCQQRRARSAWPGDFPLDFFARITNAELTHSCAFFVDCVVSCTAGVYLRRATSDTPCVCFDLIDVTHAVTRTR